MKKGIIPLKQSELISELISGIKQSELIRKKHEKNYNFLNYTEHLLLSASTATKYVSISSFAFLVGILVGIASSVATIKIFAITEVIKKRVS